MNKLDSIKQSVSKVAGRTGLKLKKYSPEILMGVGVVGLIGSTVLACKATLKVESVIDNAKDKLDSVDYVIENPDIYAGPESEDPYTKEDGQKDKAIIYFQTAAEFGKLYGPSIILGVASLGCILGSHKIMKKRNVAVVAAYKALEEGYNNYRRRVIDEFGEEKDKDYRYGIVKEEQTITKTDKDGKKKKVKEVVETLDPNHISQYARFFDDGCTNWSKNPEYNMLFLKSQQNYANDLLKARGHVFLNEVYDMLGIPRSQAGAVVGWVLNENGDNFVDFGMYDLDNEKARDFINGYESAILLDFNVDGVIYDLI